MWGEGKWKWNKLTYVQVPIMDMGPDGRYIKIATKYIQFKGQKPNREIYIPVSGREKVSCTYRKDNAGTVVMSKKRAADFVGHRESAIGSEVFLRQWRIHRGVEDNRGVRVTTVEPKSKGFAGNSIRSMNDLRSSTKARKSVNRPLNSTSAPFIGPERKSFRTHEQSASSRRLSVTSTWSAQANMDEMDLDTMSDYVTFAPPAKSAEVPLANVKPRPKPRPSSVAVATPNATTTGRPRSVTSLWSVQKTGLSTGPECSVETLDGRDRLLRNRPNWELDYKVGGRPKSIGCVAGYCESDAASNSTSFDSVSSYFGGGDDALAIQAFTRETLQASTSVDDAGLNLYKIEFRMSKQMDETMAFNAIRQSVRSRSEAMFTGLDLNDTSSLPPIRIPPRTPVM